MQRIRRYSAFAPEMGPPDVPYPAPRTNPNPLQWGSQQVFQPPWNDGDERPVTSLDKASAEWRVPQVQNLVLSLDGVTIDVQDAVFRWHLQFGAGGGNANLLIDASGTQQISISAETLRVGLRCTNWGPNWPAPPFAGPDVPVTANVFFADGMTATNAPTYTERFFVAGLASSITLLPPKGATGWRILGEAAGIAGTSPFTTGISYQILPNSGGFPLEVYEGPYLEGIRIATINFPAAAAGILVSTPGLGQDVAGAIEWEIDL